MARGWWAGAIFVVLCGLAFYSGMHLLADDIRQQDIYYSFVEGERITNGANPYARIHGSDMQANQKYATYFPLFYELSAISIKAGLIAFPAWLQFWQVVFQIAMLSVGGLILILFQAKNWTVPGLLAVAVWFFNPWTVYVSFIAHLDFLAIFPFVLALVLYPRYRTWGLLSYGASLALKQIAIFVLPLFLIWEWQRAGGRKVRSVSTAAALIGVIPLLAMLPFLWLDASGFIQSLLFSVTRQPQAVVTSFDVASALHLTGLAARIPLLAALVVICLAAWKRWLGKFLSAFLAMLAFALLNPVTFPQYLVWPMALLPFVFYKAYEMYSAGRLFVFGYRLG